MAKVTQLWEVEPPPAPQPTGPECLVMIYRLSGLFMSLGGCEAEPDDPLFPWIGDNDEFEPVPAGKGVDLNDLIRPKDPEGGE